MRNDFIREIQMQRSGTLVHKDGSLTMFPYTPIDIHDAKAMFQGKFHDLTKLAETINQHMTIEKTFYKLAGTSVFNPTYKNIDCMEDVLIILKPKAVFMLLCTLNATLSVQCRIRPIEHNIGSFAKYLTSLSIAAKLVADEVGYSDPNEALLSAFMQDVGYLFYFSVMQNPKKNSILEPNKYIKYSTGILQEFGAPFIYITIMQNMRKRNPPADSYKLSNIIHMSLLIIDVIYEIPDFRYHDKIFDYGEIAESNLGMNSGSMLRKLTIRDRISEVHDALSCII